MFKEAEFLILSRLELEGVLTNKLEEMIDVSFLSLKFLVPKLQAADNDVWLRSKL